MKLKKLELTNFRNISSLSLDLKNGTTMLVGENAQGKTNVIEAIFLLATGYSHRAVRDKELVKNGEDFALLSCVADTRFGEVKVKIKVVGNKKELFINDLPVKKIGDIFGNINAVFFAPDELKLVSEAPEDRRRFLDISLSQISKKYFTALKNYKSILLQRNALLKNPNLETITETLPLWDEQLISYASTIIKERREYILELAPLAYNFHYYLSDKREELKLSMDKEYLGGEGEIKAKLKRELEESVEKDVGLGYTTVGPHRDDIKIIVNDTNVKTYGSRGQQKTVALAIKLAEMEIFKNRTGEYPLLLLDDVYSELDRGRRDKMTNLISGVQTFITTTGAENEYKNADMILIVEGGIVRVNKG